MPSPQLFPLASQPQIQLLNLPYQRGRKSSNDPGAIELLPVKSSSDTIFCLHFSLPSSYDTYFSRILDSDFSPIFSLNVTAAVNYGVKITKLSTEYVGILD